MNGLFLVSFWKKFFSCCWQGFKRPPPPGTVDFAVGRWAIGWAIEFWAMCDRIPGDGRSGEILLTPPPFQRFSQNRKGGVFWRPPLFPIEKKRSKFFRFAETKGGVFWRGGGCFWRISPDSVHQWYRQYVYRPPIAQVDSH